LGRVGGTIALPAELTVWRLGSGTRHSIGRADYGTVRTAAFMGYRMIAEMAGLEWHETGKTDGHGVIQIADRKWGGYLANITPADFEQFYAPRLPAGMRGDEFLQQYRNY
jgi:galactokinase